MHDKIELLKSWISTGQVTTANNRNIDDLMTLVNQIGLSMGPRLSPKADKVDEDLKKFMGTVQYDEDQIIWGVDEKGGHQRLLDVRAYGAIQNLFLDSEGKVDFEKANEFQDRMGEFIAAAINEKLNPNAYATTVENKKLIDEAREIIQNLKAYGMIHTITAVVYPDGTHEEFISKATDWLEKYYKNRKPENS